MLLWGNGKRVRVGIVFNIRPSGIGITAHQVTIKLNSRLAYAPGETLQLTGSQVVNSSSISITVRIVIRQIIQLATTGSYAKTTNGSQRFEIGSKEVSPSSSIGLDDFQAVVPALPPSFFGARGSSTARREPLTFTYELSLQAKASSGHKVKVDMPILISALPPKQQAIQDANASNTNVPLFITRLKFKVMPLLMTLLAILLSWPLGLRMEEGKSLTVLLVLQISMNQKMQGVLLILICISHRLSLINRLSIQLRNLLLQLMSGTTKPITQMRTTVSLRT